VPRMRPVLYGPVVAWPASRWFLSTNTRNIRLQLQPVKSFLSSFSSSSLAIVATKDSMVVAFITV